MKKYLTNMSHLRLENTKSGAGRYRIDKRASFLP